MKKAFSKLVNVLEKLGKSGGIEDGTMEKLMSSLKKLSHAIRTGNKLNIQKEIETLSKILLTI